MAGKSHGTKAGEQERRLTAIVHRHIKELLSIVAGSATSTRISSAQFEALSIVLMPPFNSGPYPACAQRSSCGIRVLACVLTHTPFAACQVTSSTKP